MLSESVLELIEKSPLSKKIKKLTELLKPTLLIQPQSIAEDALPRGASRFGGAPDLPPTVQWPVVRGVPLSFIAQICLRELHAVWGQQLPLPLSGWIYFFAETDEKRNLNPQAKATDIVKVLHIDVAESELERRKPPQAPSFFSLAFQKIYELPSADESPALQRSLNRLETVYRKEYEKKEYEFQQRLMREPQLAPTLAWTDLPADEYRRRKDHYDSICPRLDYNFYNNMYEALKQEIEELQRQGEVTEHRLFGYPNLCQDHKPPGVLLLQLGSVVDGASKGPSEWIWGSYGSLNFFLTEEELQATHLDRVAGLLDFT